MIEFPHRRRSMGPMRLYEFLLVCLCGSGIASKPAMSQPSLKTWRKKWRRLSRVLHSFWWSNFPTGGVAWGPCVYTCLLVQIRSCMQNRNVPSIPYKNGGSFQNCKLAFTVRLGLLTRLYNKLINSTPWELRPAKKLLKSVCENPTGGVA